MISTSIQIYFFFFLVKKKKETKIMKQASVWKNI